MNIVYVSVSDYLQLILKSYNVLVCLTGIKNFVNQKALLYKHMSIFVPLKYDILSHLRHSYADGPFWAWTSKLLVKIFAEIHFE